MIAPEPGVFWRVATDVVLVVAMLVIVGAGIALFHALVKGDRDVAALDAAAVRASRARLVSATRAGSRPADLSGVHADDPGLARGGVRPFSVGAAKGFRRGGPAHGSEQER